MIKKGAIKLLDVIFIFSKPPEKALVGVVKKINYPIVSIDVVKREGGSKFKSKEQIDLSGNLALTILDEDKINQCLTDREIKRLKKLKDEEIMDMFEGTY